MALPVLTPNSPSAGYIAWTSFSIRYGNVNVTIPAGNTNKRYAYWLWNGGAPAASLVFADVLPALSADDLLVFVNRGGIPLNVTNANVIEGSIIATDSIIGTSIQANTVDASKLLADTITSREIQAGAVTASELSISSFGGLQAINGEMDDVDPVTKIPAAWTAGFERSGTAPAYAQETAAPLSGSTSVAITLAANSTEALAGTATPCKPGDLISFGVACRSSVVGAPITIRAYFGTTPTFTRSQLVAATPDTPTNVVVYDVTAAGLVARSGLPVPVSGAGIAAPVDGWAAPVTTSLFVVGQVKVPAGATFVRFVLASGLIAASPAHTMVWDSLEYAPIVTSVKLADGAVTAEKISATAIDGKTVTGATIYSGPPTAAHARMDPLGFRTFTLVNAGTDEQEVRETSRIGGGSGDVLALYSGDDATFSVDATGFVQATKFSSDTDFDISGTPLMGRGAEVFGARNFGTSWETGRDLAANPLGVVESLAGGVVGYYGNSNVPTTVMSAAGAYVLLSRVTADLEMGRFYTVSTGQYLALVPTGAVIGMFLRYTLDGTDPTISSAILARAYVTGSGSYQTLQIAHRPVAGTSSQRDLRILAQISYLSGAGNVTPVGDPFYVSIIDQGYQPDPNTGILINATTQAAGPPPTQPVTKKTYTTTWTAGDSQTRRGTSGYGNNTINSTAYTGSTKILAGQVSSSNGNQHAYVSFPYNATAGSETGKTITSAIAGSTIKKVELWVKNASTYSSGGGQQRFAMTTMGAISTATTLAPPAVTYGASESFSSGQGKWVTLPLAAAAAALSGGGRVVLIGPGASTSTLYYNGWNNHAAPTGTKPQLRVTYEK